jgi:ABC-2 type transport system ATP-binding protein
MAVLHAGRLRFAGTPAELKARYSTPVLEEAFLSCISGNS